MYLEVDGQELEIKLSTDREGINYLYEEKGVMHLSVHVNIPKAELLQYLRIYLGKLKKPIRRSSLTPTEIRIFEKTYVLKLDHNVHRPYIRENSIITSKIPQSPKTLMQLKDQLLHRFILEQIGLWEERLDFLSHGIILKNLPKNFYTISKDKSTIVFSKKLIEKSIGIISYIIADALFAVLEIQEEEQKKLYERYVKDWKYIAKVITFELQ